MNIPISAAEKIAKQYNWDQVIIVARNTTSGKEHVTTYGRNKDHCQAAAVIGDFLKYKVMNWIKENE